jgi:hypothetical protein
VFVPMGNILSEERIELAIAKLEDVIWEYPYPIEFKHIKLIFDDCNIVSQSTKDQIKACMLLKEEEHEDKCRAFLKNNVLDMYQHHSKMSYRYGRVVYLIQLRYGF